jgi:hypothetical protein
MGEWQITGSHPYFPEVELYGRASFRWYEGGAFVILHYEIDNENFPDGVEIFGSDNVSKEYVMLHFDERCISRRYDVSTEKDGITWWRDDSDFSQRFSLVIHDDGTMMSTGKMRRKGADWEDDLKLFYKRV